MSDLLLGTHALKLLAAGEVRLADWLETRGETPVHATYASIASLLASAEGSSDVALRRAWIECLTQDIPSRFGPRLHGFDLAAAQQWSAARAMLPPKIRLVEHDLLVVAVALAEDLDYIAPREPWHGLVAGLQQYDPWTETFYPR